MTKTTSTRRLALWAQYGADSALVRVNREDAYAARVHGLAAVRAVSRIRFSEGRRMQDPVLDAYEAKSESRLAFRAALAAVGLRTL
jgi:hypothetical protein